MALLPATYHRLPAVMQGIQRLIFELADEMHSFRITIGVKRIRKFTLFMISYAALGYKKFKLQQTTALKKKLLIIFM